jgi:hypothetical protein
MNKDLKTEPIDHIHLYQIINKTISSKLYDLAESLSGKEKDKLIDLADYVLLKELYL